MQDSKDHSVFLFREQIHLKVKFCSPIRFVGHAVLADENKECEEDRFKRDNRRQKTERKRIERFKTEQPCIREDPNQKPEGVDHERGPATRLSGDPC